MGQLISYKTVQVKAEWPEGKRALGRRAAKNTSELLMLLLSCQKLLDA